MSSNHFVYNQKLSLVWLKLVNFTRCNFGFLDIREQLAIFTLLSKIGPIRFVLTEVLNEKNYSVSRFHPVGVNSTKLRRKLMLSKALVSAVQLSARSIRLSASAAQIHNGERERTQNQ